MIVLIKIFGTPPIVSLPGYFIETTCQSTTKLKLCHCIIVEPVRLANLTMISESNKKEAFTQRTKSIRMSSGNLLQKPAVPQRYQSNEETVDYEVKFTFVFPLIV